jgi:hypothetical protein
MRHLEDVCSRPVDCHLCHELPPQLRALVRDVRRRALSGRVALVHSVAGPRSGLGR